MNISNFFDSTPITKNTSYYQFRNKSIYEKLILLILVKIGVVSQAKLKFTITYKH
ncbi:hypothetical protein NVI2019_NGLDDFDA_04004 (plasmid) [Providencia alcalifaciens]|nr:hypothetical protein NVI2019_NGLDDFDA_04004 [Providencia alcalifaciens]